MTQSPQQGSAPAIEPTAEIQRLSKTASELSDLLKAHQNTLAQRGMAAPSGAPENLQTIGGELQRLTTFLDSSQIELQQLRELARTTDLVNSTLDLDIVLDDVIDTVIQLTGAERGYIVLKDPETEELTFRVARDKNKQDINPTQFVVSRTIVDRVAKQGELLVTVSALEDTQFKDVESVANLQLRSILCVPLKRKGQITGVIYADNRMRPNLFSAREQKLVNAFANQAAVAIENARLFERVRLALEEITSTKDFMYDVFASIASGVITTDAEDRITTFNSAAARILEVPAERAIGQTLFSVLPPLYDGFERLVADVREHNQNQTVAVEPVLDVRGQVNLDLKLSPLKDGAITQGVAIVVDDLTELRQRQGQIDLVKRYLPPEMVDNIKTIDELELGGVEREVSILFCDVRGFTTFSESLEPEVLMETINRYLTVSSNAIHSQGGIIDKFMGDAAVGLFNTQLNPQEDHALRAVNAGLLMAQHVLDLHQELDEDKRLFYGIGAHTAPAILGNVGSPSRKEFTVLGNTLQFAKLLQENALKGEVIISEETYNIVKNYVEAESLEPRKAVGHPEFTIMYRVTNIHA